MNTKVKIATFNRRQSLALLTCAFSGGAYSQGWPDKPLRLFVGYPAGGGTDYVARLVANLLSKELAQSVVVVNLPGATGAIALERVARAQPGGDTLIMISAADTLLPALRAKLPFNMGRDLAPVAPAVMGALGLVVNPALPVHNVKELIALAQAQPNKLNYASPGVGNSQHLAGEMFNLLAKVKIVHVPFKGGAEAIKAVVSGEVQIAFASLAPVLQLVEGGKLRMLAVTPKTRSTALPHVPTLAEAGVTGYSRSTWFGVAAPAGTSKDILQKINAAMHRGMQDAETKEILLKQGMEPMIQTVDQFNAFVQNELAQNAALVKDMGIKAE